MGWRIAVAILLLAVGLALVVGGGQLALLGGSWYYLLAGLAITVSGGLVWFGGSRAGSVYVLMLLATLAWSVTEVGFAWWELVPRLGMLLIFGLVFFLPPLRSPPVAMDARSGCGR